MTISRRAALSVGVAGLAALIAACSSDDDAAAGDAIGKVLVVGAGPAGLTTAHLLHQRGVEVEVLEAAPTHGGRIKHDLTFADFPISLGGEWVHVEPGILAEIVNDPAVEISTPLVENGPDSELDWYEGGELVTLPLDDTDLKFAGSSWLGFFDAHIVPGIAELISYNTQVTRIEHGDDGIVVTDAGGVAHKADRVVVTVPIAVLRRGDIEFAPPLGTDRVSVLDEAPIWSGFKAFFEFDEQFYPAALGIAGDDSVDGQRLFYDAAYGQTTEFNILGLFSVGDWAQRYQALGPDGVRDDVLALLDEIYDGVASATYRRHIVQDWNAEPFANGGYLSDWASTRVSDALAAPIGDRVFFAGDGYTDFDDWSSVHAAARSAAATVDRLTNL